MDDADFISFDYLDIVFKQTELTTEQIKYINRGSQNHEPVELQLKN